jgi:phosphatidylinositol alpha-1,6-mannosyltransferase
VVASAHGHEVWWARLPGSRRALRAIGDAVDVLTVDSAVVRRPIGRALSGRAAGRVVLLSPGVDAARFSARPAPRRGRAPRWPDGADRDDTGGPVVLCLSRAVPRKGHARLLALWPELRRRHPAARLVLAGDGPELPALRRTAAGLTGVDVLGRVPEADLAGLYAAADVFVLPVADRLGGLVTESLGIVLLEAAAAGLPVVSGRAGGTAEAVLHERTGLLVDATDRSQLFQAVDRLMGDGGLRRTLGQAGQAWVRSAWTWDRTASRLQALLAGDHVPRW